MLRTSATKTIRSSTSLLSTATRRAQPQCLSIASQQQSRQQHAVSNPTLANIEKRWEQMPPQEQAELWMALRDRMTVDWKELTTQEKKACEYFVLFNSLKQGKGWGLCHVTIGATSILAGPRRPSGDEITRWDENA